MVTVTPKMVEEYEEGRLTRLEKQAKDAPTLVKYKWAPPKLNDDGSLADGEQEKDRADKAGSKEAWGGEAKEV